MISDVSICNKALVKVGADVISSLTQDTKSARILNAIYEDTRDSVMQARAWNFAIKRDTLTPEVTTPEYEFDFLYNLPADCLQVLDLEEEFQSEEEYAIENGQLLCNINPITLRYIFRNTDPSSYSPMFAEALACKLAENIAYALTQSSTLKDQMARDYDKALTFASSRDSMEGTMKVFVADQWINARRG